MYPGKIANDDGVDLSDQWLILTSADNIVLEANSDYPGMLERMDHTYRDVDCELQAYIDIIQHVYNTGVPNFQKARIPVCTKWNIPLLEGLLSEYHDAQILDFLVYGWPIDRNPDIPLEMGGRNHAGATNFPEHIDAYIHKETSLKAQIGPFDSIPFQSHTMVAISPLSTREKRDTTQRRIIMDCSWPIGSSLNDGLNKNKYLGLDICLKYPTVDTLARRIFQLYQDDPDQDILLFKEDLE